MSPACPEVSVVIATYNMGRFVSEAVESVLAQAAVELEVIVVDDGSDDDTLAVMEAFKADPRVRLVVQQNQGQPRAKNAGIRASRGRFIAFCDADDYWLPNKLALQLPLFENNARVGVVCSSTLALQEDGQVRSHPHAPLQRGRVLESLFQRNIIPFGTAIIRRECLDQAGLFDESIAMGIDWDLWLRIAVDWEFDFTPEPTYVYRIWSGQMSRNWRGRYEHAFRIMAKFLACHPDRVAPAVVASAYADTYTNLAAEELNHVGMRACLATLGKALRHRATFWPAWRLLLLMPWYRYRALRP